MDDLVVAIDDPRAEDVRVLLERHLAFAAEHSPPEHVHALDVGRLVDPAVTFVAARRAGEVVGVGALKHLDGRHGELKSMHVRDTARGTGVAQAVLGHLLDLARTRGYERVSLETGTMDAFAPARALYARAGFVDGPPFADYTDNPYSTCMTLPMGRGRR